VRTAQRCLAFQSCVVYPAAALRIHREEIVPIILAAGSSKHLALPKPLAKFDGKTALQLAVANCEGLGGAIVVLGSDARKIRPAVPRGVRVILNTRWRQGQMSSLRCALRHVRRSSAFMIYPVDHALLRKRTVQALVRAFHSRDVSKEIVMPQHNGRLGHPIIVAPTLRGEFLYAQTAREIVYSDPRRNLVIRVRTRTIYEDFENPQSYRRCLRKFLGARRSHPKRG
jgi:CTP:molybdopterin cytidylyltransferase MocA